jgi:hypothetical protein
MLTWEDCIGLSELTPEEIAAIAEHEHLPEIAALEFGNYLIHRPDGAPAIKRMILDDIAEAERRGDRRHVLALKLVLHHFCRCHAQELGRSAPSAEDMRRSLKHLVGDEAPA